MASFDYGYGPTAAQFEEYTNRQVTNQVEFERQRARAQEVFDDIAGPWGEFQDRYERKLELTATGTNTFTASNVSSSKDDMFNNMEVRVVQGNGSGFSGYIADYDGTTKECTVSGVFGGDWSAVDTNSVAIITDIAVFPRSIDIDVDSRPRLPYQLPRIISYIIEYWVNLESQEGWNAEQIANGQPDIIQEGIGDWQTTFKGDRSVVRQLIGSKAYDLSIREGLLNRTARLKRFRSGPHSRRLI
jgi:hypothetical protein